MTDRTRNRSDSYQFLIVETLFAPEMLSDFTNSDSIGARLNPFGYNDELDDLRERLKESFWRIVGMLTKRQQQVIRLYCAGLTQIEIAKKLGVNQSSITKSINGNCDYKNGKRNYGGGKRRLIKLAEKDPEIQEILAKIKEISSE